MGLVTLDTIAAGFRSPAVFTKNAFTGEASGQIHSLMGVAGNPAAIAFSTPGLNGATVSIASAIGGMLPHTNPPATVSGYVGKMSGFLGANIAGLILYDLLWYNTGIGITTTTAQAITSPTWPARDKNGATNGDGLEVWLYASATTGNAGAIANTSIAYTNQAGTSGRSASLAYSAPASMVAGTVVPFALQSGDTGVRSIQSLTLGTSYVSGAVNLLLVRRLASIFGAPNTGVTADAYDLGLPQVHNDSAVYLAAVLAGTAAGATFGEVNFCHV